MNVSLQCMYVPHLDPSFVKNLPDGLLNSISPFEPTESFVLSLHYLATLRGDTRQISAMA